MPRSAFSCRSIGSSLRPRGFQMKRQATFLRLRSRVFGRCRYEGSASLRLIGTDAQFVDQGTDSLHIGP